jgi:hypothetical protein
MYFIEIVSWKELPLNETSITNVLTRNELSLVQWDCSISFGKRSGYQLDLELLLPSIAIGVGKYDEKWIGRVGRHGGGEVQPSATY